MKESTMTDFNNIARNYIALWNERAPQRRREMLAAHWTADARYVDPLMSGDGHDGVDALIAGVQHPQHHRVPRSGAGGITDA
jgi:hypothetical protein